MDAAQVERVRQSFGKATEMEIFPYRFYATLWSRYPTSRAFFKEDMKIQRERLVSALEWTMTNLDNPKVLVPRLKKLGRNHATRYRIQPFHYDWVEDALLATFQELLEPEGLWTAGIERDVTDAYTFAAKTMIEGAEEGYGEAIPFDGEGVTFHRIGILRPGYVKGDVDDHISILTGMLRQATTDYADSLRDLELADQLIARLHEYIKQSDLKDPSMATPKPVDNATIDELIAGQKAADKANGRR